MLTYYSIFIRFIDRLQTDLSFCEEQIMGKVVAAVKRRMRLPDDLKSVRC